MKINWSKVLMGGLIAGVVLIAIDLVVQTYLLGPKSVAELDAFKPGLGSSMTQGNGLVIYIVLDAIFGVLLVWLYAAIRPRFGPGAATAVKAAVAAWIVQCIAYYGWLQMGMFSAGLWWSFAIAGLVGLVLASCAGARFYSEEGAA
ncbi:MAG: hypothetical protein M3Z17_08765 [Gemmatimonadota bacterium]|nr:hypothetical protein [Gemmatimonadota bacterium]